MNKFNTNEWNTSDLVLYVMERCARTLGLDINDNKVADELYWICCRLESHPEGHGFGSSDAYSFIKEAAKTFDIDWKW